MFRAIWPQRVLENCWLGLWIMNTSRIMNNNLSFGNANLFWPYGRILGVEVFAKNNVLSVRYDNKVNLVAFVEWLATTATLNQKLHECHHHHHYWNFSAFSLCNRWRLKQTISLQSPIIFELYKPNDFINQRNYRF